MSSKLTLLIDEDVISNAKDYAQNHGVSLSKMVERYFQFISDSGKKKEIIPPITKELTGIAKIISRSTDKELLVNALNKRYLQ